MGFGGLIPADKLAATYNPTSRKLVLYAEGTVHAATYGFNFERLPWFGGLKFSLDGWIGPLFQKEHKYVWEQAFDIQPLSSVDPSNTVIIVTANHPKGEVVPIHWLGVKDQPPKDDATSNKPAPSEPQLLSAPGVQLNELFRLPFIIKQPASVPKGGSVQIKFDPTYLTLTGSGIQDADINWTFNSLQTGNTQIFVTVYGGIAKFVYQIVYNVRIFVLETGTGASKARIATETADADGEDEILSFLGRVNIAVRLVQEKFPDAELYEVDATPNHPGSVTNPLELAHLKVVFNVEKDGKQGTAIISSIGWGEFGPVQYVPKPWLEDVVISWPPTGLSEPTTADDILKKAGYTQPYTSLTLRQPLYPGDTEPYYIFTLVNHTIVLVGAKDGNVIVNGEVGK